VLGRCASLTVPVCPLVTTVVGSVARSLLSVTERADDHPGDDDTGETSIGASAAAVVPVPAAARVPATIDPDQLPELAAPTPPPPRSARLLGVLAIVVGGLCGGLIGWAFADLQCTGGCGQGWSAFGGIVGAAAGAGGVAVITSLALRAMREWETVKEKE
jgi:hypothetical protein